MNNPTIADNKPMQINLEPGKEYYFCACGLSKTQPYCDGSHSGTGISPLAFKAEQENNYLCMCKHSKNLPFCDGNHKQFSDEQVGQEGPDSN